MNIEKLYLKTLFYIIFAGYIPVIIMYIIGFKTLGIFEDVGISTTILSLLMVSFPILIPLIISPIYIKYFIRNSNRELISRLWKMTLFYGVVFVIIIEFLLYFIEPLWSGLGILAGGLNIFILSLFAYINKVKVKKRKV